MYIKEKEQFAVKNVYLSAYFVYQFLRVIFVVILLAVIPFIIFIKQDSYIIIEKDELQTLFSNINNTLQNVNHTLSDISLLLETVEKLKYNITVSNITFENIQSGQCGNIPPTLRFDCHPEAGVSEVSCTGRGCCWNPQGQILIKRYPLNVPYCYYPRDWSIYKYKNFTRKGHDFSGFLQLTKNSFYKADLPLIKVEINSIDKSTFHIKMYDPLKKRYEPPWPTIVKSKNILQENVNTQYKVDIDMNKLGFRVYRTIDNATIFDSISAGGFIFADQFLQISALLPTHNIYGIGEHQSNLKLSTNWQSFTLFNKDQPPTENANLYGSHPFYIMMENSGKSHGVLFLNSNAMDVILQPSPGITFRTIGGIFDIYFFLGPSPADVIQQYSIIVGKPFLPPYWSLGFHLCRYGYRSLDKTRDVWNRTIAAGIPFDTQWNDLDYMDKNNDFTYNPNHFKDLPQFVTDLHARGMHYIPLIDAGISGSEREGTYPPYDEGLKQDMFVKDAKTNEPFVGKVWNLVSTVWPDFTNPGTKDYYYHMMNNMHLSFAYDGAWIDMNEPSNFYNGAQYGCSKNKLDYPPYVPNIIGDVLATKTLCMNAKHYLGVHYDLHNTYGLSQAIATNYALTKIRQKRPFIISRSTWVGHGHYAGHWTGDVYSTWHDLRMSIPAILSSNFNQIPMVGADICGFNGNTTVALCNRWMQLGAFYPFSLMHSRLSALSMYIQEQDPVALGELVVESARRALTIRYWLLPYLYTLFFRAHQLGETVVRPLFFEFSNDPVTYDIDTQFLWGRSLMIVPVLEENKTSVNAYLPLELWYNFYTKMPILALGKYYTLSAPLNVIPLMVRGGSILPAQKPADTTTNSRKNSFELLIALDTAKLAKGELYYDDGDSLDSFERGQFLWLLFSVENNILSVTKIKESAFNDKIILDKVQIWGVRCNVSQTTLNDRDIGFKYNNTEKCLYTSNLQVDLREKFMLSWKCVDLEQHGNM